LGVDAIDLFQFHTWNYADPRWLDCLFWLQELQGDGQIRHLGLTNVDTAHLRMVVRSGIPVVTNQVCFSLLDRRPLARMTAACEELGVKLLAYGTVAAPPDAGGAVDSRQCGRSWRPSRRSR
jgi:aryl-alcohol dehydrogenase-like predicted oxidoreductase